jgi:cAMP-dependent protein kinase regulator
MTSAGADAAQISEDKKRFVLDILNPMLEEMVAKAITEMPPDPVPFMLDFLEAKRVDKEDKLLTEDERERLKLENEELKENMAKVKSEMQETAKLVSQAKEDEEEEEDDDDDDGEPPPDFYKNMEKQGARTSVSAEAYGEWNAKKAFVAPVISKTEEQKQRLKACLSRSFLFSTLGQNDLNVVIGAMKEVKANAKQRVIVQGDSGDFLFVIETGKLDCVIKVDGVDKVVKTCEAGDVFGELALLYNCPRAASVDARDVCVLWQLDRDTFNNIVKEAAQKKRECYDAFLAKVPLLASMDAYERSQLADALKVEEFTSGSLICREGEDGSSFYIIEEGSAVATKSGNEVMTYGPGDYFGELALLRNQPRAATVVAKSNTSLLSLDSRSFKRLLNVGDLLERSNRYK